MELRGTFTALITPFIKDEIDEEGLRELIHRQCEAGVSGILFLGTTAESSTLTEEEQKRVIQIGVEEGKGKTLILVGTGTNCTRTTLEKTLHAQALGADIAQIVTPYYNKPTQEGLYQHYKTLANQVDIPLIIYNIPGRTGVTIETETLSKIVSLPSVIGLKDCSGDLNQLADICFKHPDLSLLSGDDALSLPMIALGAKGLISVVSNLIPTEIVNLVNAALEGRLSDARHLYKQLLPLFRLAFIEANPIPIKYAMSLSNLPSGSCRLPLCDLKEENQKKLKLFLQNNELTSLLDLSRNSPFYRF